MPVINRVGDLLTDNKVNVICHQANLFHTFGSGIARSIKEMYPEAYEADCATRHGDVGKLGTYSYAVTKNGKMVMNCYSQTGMGATDRNTSYNDIYVIFKDLKERVERANSGGINKRVLGVPYMYGCGLAGGRWRIVNAIFEDLFKDSYIELHVVRLPQIPEIPL